MKVTERTLVDICRKVNNEQMKHWDSGLKVERRGVEYVVLRLFRKPQMERPGSLELFQGSSREVKAFIEGFANAAEIDNNGAGGEAKARSGLPIDNHSDFSMLGVFQLTLEVKRCTKMA